MVTLNSGKSGLALLFGGGSGYPAYCAIGSGSGAVAVTDTSLVAEFDRNVFATTDTSVEKYTTFTTDFNSVSMSGNILKEFAISSSGASMSGTHWNREGFAGITFDGSTELQVQCKFEIY